MRLLAHANFSRSCGNNVRIEAICKHFLVYLIWSYLFFGSGVIVLIEYRTFIWSNLAWVYRRLTSQHFLASTLSMLGFLGDRCRARKLIFTVSTAVVFLTTLAPLLPLVVSFPTCFANESDARETNINQVNNHYINIYKGFPIRPVTCRLTDNQIISYFQAPNYILSCHHQYK